MKKLITASVLFFGLTAFSQECFLGEIKMFSGNFAPRGWALAQGQTLSISQHTALFSILGTTYGGDGRTTFSLPDLRGRTAIGTGQSPGLQRYRLGQKVGAERHLIGANNLPATNNGSISYTGLEIYKEVNVSTAKKAGKNTIAIPLVRTANLQAPFSVNGGGSPIANAQPSLSINHIICMQGLYPSRN